MFIVRQTEEFVAWLDALKDKRAQVRVAVCGRQRLEVSDDYPSRIETGI